MASMLDLFRILICFCVLSPLGSLGYICLGPVYPSQGLSYARIESNISGRANEGYAKIRMKIIYDTSIEGKHYKPIVQQAADFWAQALSVKPVDGRIFKSRNCESKNTTVYIDLDGSGKKQKYCLGSCATVTKCEYVEIPSEHLDGCKNCTKEGQNCTEDQPELGSGVDNADLVFYASAIDETICLSGDIVAYAAPCELEPDLDRPVFALINICPTEASKYDNKVLLRTIKHEVMHALGFGNYLFRRFRGKDGKALWSRDKNGQPSDESEKNLTQSVIKTIVRDWHVRGQVIKSERAFLVTPRVVEEVRSHFGCSDLEGAELEEFGGSVTRYSHLEARVFYDDGMKGNIGTGKGLFSRIDFAVLEDSGWYQVNYSQAEDMEFGRNLSCDFCKKSCKFWMDLKRQENKSIEPYCDSPDFSIDANFTCIGSKKHFSGCLLGKVLRETLKRIPNPNSSEPFSQLPEMYQNFDNISGVSEEEIPMYGSLDEYPDFCPIQMRNWDMKPLIKVIGNLDCGQESKPAETPKPTEEFKDEEHQKVNQSSSFGSSVLLVTLFIWMVFTL